MGGFWSNFGHMSSIVNTTLEGLLPNFRGKYEFNVPDGYNLQWSRSLEQPKEDNSNVITYIVIGFALVIVVLLFGFRNRK